MLVVKGTVLFFMNEFATQPKKKISKRQIDPIY